jgi:transcriptional regulator with XRE-family HTH domain
MARQFQLGDRHINVAALARTIGEDQSYVWRILAGERNPKFRYLQKIARALDMSADELVGTIDQRKKMKELETLAAFWNIYLADLRKKQAELVEGGLSRAVANAEARRQLATFKAGLGL